MQQRQPPSIPKSSGRTSPTLVGGRNAGAADFGTRSAPGAFNRHPPVRQTGAQRGATAVVNVSKPRLSAPTATGLDRSVIWESPILTSATPDYAEITPVS